jgi:hypothetical protein
VVRKPWEKKDLVEALTRAMARGDRPAALRTGTGG